MTLQVCISKPAQKSQCQLPSQKDVVCHLYLLSDAHTFTKPKTRDNCKTLAEIILRIWQQANPNLYKMSERSVTNKVELLVTVAISINQNKQKQ